MPRKSTSTKKKRSTAKKTTTAVNTITQSPYSFKQFVDFLNHNFSLIFIVGVMFIGGFIAGSLWTENQILKTGSEKGAEIVKKAPVDSGLPTEETLKKMPKVNKSDHQIGAKKPTLTIVEYSDYECPFCKRFYNTMTQVIDTYGDQVSWVYRHYPLVSLHPNAQKVSETAECIAKYGGEDAFWKFTDTIYESIAEDKTITQLDNLLKISTNLGVNSTKVKTCVDNGDMTKLVKEQQQGGQAAGISGTPGSMIVTKDGQYELIPGALPFEQMKNILDKYLE